MLLVTCHFQTKNSIFWRKQEYVGTSYSCRLYWISASCHFLVFVLLPNLCCVGHRNHWRYVSEMRHELKKSIWGWFWPSYSSYISQFNDQPHMLDLKFHIEENCQGGHHGCKLWTQQLVGEELCSWSPQQPALFIICMDWVVKTNTNTNKSVYDVIFHYIHKIFTKLLSPTKPHSQAMLNVDQTILEVWWFFFAQPPRKGLLFWCSRVTK